MSGAAPEVAVTWHQADVEPVLDRLDGRRLVIADGDGTLHDALNRLWRRHLLDAPVAFVPLGTANALARGVGVPLDVAAAGRVALEGRARDLDLISGDDSSVVVNDVHTGVGVAQPDAVAAAKRVIGRFASGCHGAPLVCGLGSHAHRIGWSTTTTGHLRRRRPGYVVTR